jgi:PKD repeat protein
MRELCSGKPNVLRQMNGSFVPTTLLIKRYFFLKHWKAYAFLLGISVLMLIPEMANGQTCTSCDASVPAITIDFSSNPDTSVVISGTTRNGHCCSATGGSRCIRFNMTVHPLSANISFETSDHGVSGFYQINCGTPYSTGDPMCITGLTTFCLTYCKNGGDHPDYTIKVSRGFGTSSDIQVRGDGTCPKQLSVSGLNEPSIVWNSIYPGLPGAYNSYLSTTVASDTVLVNPTTIPAGGYIDYQVCGQAVGCSTANLCDTVRVYIYSTLALSLTPADPVICTGSAGTGSVVLTATLTGGKLPYTYSWTGPGGFTSSLQSPTVSAVGTYIATVNDSLGCAYLTDTLLVTSNLIPDVNSSGTGSVCSGLPLNYSIGSTVSGSTYTWSRAAVAGISNAAVSGQTSSVITEALINTTASPINVTYLVVPTNGVCAGGVFTYVVTVYPKPTASFTMNSANQCLSGNSVAFNSSSSLANSYSWSFGDGATSSAQNPTYSYATAGTYQVKLVVTTNNGCKDSITQAVTVYPQPTSVSYTINNGNQCLTGNSFSFATNATVSAGTVSYAWNFGDGGNSTAQNPSHGYAAAGTYQVKLIVTTNNGCKDSTTQSVTVFPQPAASFTIGNSTQCLSNNSFAFTSTSTVSSGSIANYSWSFGDGATSSAQNPTYSYATAGTYQVKLVVTTNNGCKDSITQAVTVYPQPTSVSYTINNGNQCLTGNSFSFATNATVSPGTVGYAWNFGDGGNSTAQNPSHSYATAGTYQVKLIVTTNNGCKDSTTQSVTVFPQPAASFTIGNSTQCLSNNSFAFISTSTVSSGSISGYSWSFGDGATSSAQNPTYSYATAGTYQVKLVVTTNNGCKDSITQAVTVYPQPTSVSYTINNGNQCLTGNSFAFNTNATVSAGTVSYAWNFGDGGTSTAQNPSHGYAAAGTYQVKLIVTTNNGCKDSTTQSVTVFPQPAAAFTIGNSTQCLSNNNFAFISTSTVSGGSIANYSWSFGDGGTSTSQNPTYSYTAVGTYQVKLVVTTNNGCKDSITQSITINPQPVAGFSISNSTQCLSNNSFSFTSTSTSSGSISNYSWSFGDGGTSTSQNPTYSYTAVGTYQVKLVVTTNNGCKDSITQSITINPQPVAGFSISNSTQCLSNNSFSFTSTSTSSGSISNYSWSFGDGGTSTSQNPTYSYTAAGTYQVKLAVITSNGCKDSITQSVTVYLQPTSVSYTINSTNQCLTGNSFSFATNASVGSGTASYAWNFGDGGTSNQQNPTYNYTTAGTYQVKLIVTTNNGCKDSAIQTLTVYPQPIAAFSISNSTQCLSNNSFSFTSISTVSSGSISNYSWSFGDGATSSVQNPTYSYATAGTYQVKLAVITSNGCKDSITQSVTVYLQPTSASYTINSSNQCLTGNSFAFITNASVGSGTVSYAWNFGDGGTSNLQNPTYNYTTAGTYQVKLIVTTNNDCKDSAIQTLTVYPQPIAAFSTNNNPQCLNNNSFSFSNTSTVSSGSITSYSWSFGDGGTSSAKDPTYSYTAAGIYQVKLVITTNNGCKDSITQSISINPKPTVTNFAINTASQCLSGNNFLFTSNATVAGGTVSYAWSFGDGGTSTLQNPSYSYATAGTYQVKLAVTTNNGCKDSVAQNITVYAQPVAGYTVNTIQQCFSNNIFVFSNTSTISSGTVVQYAWNFGNGVTSSVQNPVYSYTVPGTYQVTLAITSNNGCKDSIIQSIIVSPQPTGVNFTVNSSSQCFSGNSFSFNASASVSSGNITSYNWNFGDGTTAIGPTSTHSYTAAGFYQAKLVVITDNGCKDSIIQNVTGFAQPTAGFSINNNQQCLSNNNLSFTSISTVSTGTISVYQWSFGDGQTSSAQNPTHAYTTAGIYTVKLVVTTDNGCKDTITQNITIYPQPTATSFTINSGSQCLTGNSFAFITNATVASGTITYNWNFGDGQTSTLQNPTHAYATAGTYPVRLIIITDNGCKDSVSNNVTVYPQPTGVDFTVNGTSPCVSGNSFAFNTNATVSTGTITYGWDFGDGFTSTLQNPTHTYTVGGTYDIKLVVTSNNGCRDSIVKNVTLHTQPTGVDFSINTNAQCLGSNNFLFATNATVSTGSITYSWSFGDGATSASQNPTHTYAAAGTYLVKLIIATDYGCNDSVTHSVTVYPQPMAGFSINDNQQCFTNNGFTFTSTSAVANGSIANYHWDFGDAGTSSAQNPTHAFTAAGNYQIKLVVITSNGCKDSIIQSITVYLQPTAVDFAINSSGQCLNANSFVFSTNATVSSGTVAYQWNFGDGQTSTAQNPVHAYTAAGTYQVKLVVTTNNGCADSISKSITVYPQPAGVDFIFNSSAQCLSNNGFSFSTNASVTTGSITYSWDFGDGSTSTVQNPNHVYATAGTYPVKLIIITNQGCKDSIVKNAIVYPQPTAVAYTINANNQCLNGNSVLFSTNATVAGGTVSYGWNFGDGGVSTSQNPSHVYAAAGTYLVKLIITTNNGCKDSTTQTVIVYPQPVPGFNINNNTQCYSGNGFTFTNTSTVSSGSIVNYAWTFGDGGSIHFTEPITCLCISRDVSGKAHRYHQQWMQGQCHAIR